MTKKTEQSAVEMVADKKADTAVKSDAAEQVAKDALVAEIQQDTGTTSDAEPKVNRWLGSDEIMLEAPLLELGVEAFTDAVAEKGDGSLPEQKVYGLLALERNGQNRTPYVKAMMARLGLSKDELPGGGPDYTNDVTPTSKL